MILKFQLTKILFESPSDVIVILERGSGSNWVVIRHSLSFDWKCSKLWKIKDSIWNLNFQILETSTSTLFTNWFWLLQKSRRLSSQSSKSVLTINHLTALEKTWMFWLRFFNLFVRCLFKIVEFCRIFVESLIKIRLLIG